MRDAKYKLIRAGRMRIHRTDDETKFYRIQALKDIPKYGVKAGDMGGYVNRKDILSHRGSCWIADNAQVVGDVSMTENAYVGGNAVVRVYSMFLETNRSSPIYLKGGIRVEDNASVESCHDRSKRNFVSGIFDGNAKIYGNAKLLNAYRIYANAKIHGDAILHGVFIIAGTAEVYGNAYIGNGVTLKDKVQVYGKASISDDCSILGTSKIFDNAKIDEKATIVDSIIAGDSHILRNQKVTNGKLNEMTIASTIDNSFTVSLSPTPASPVLVPDAQTPRGKVYLQTLKDVQEKISAYETDIVKIIKYPVMIDRTDLFTQAMISALNNAQRWSEYPDSDDFKDSVSTLENAFLAAESNALKVASTALSEEERKKTQNAKKLLAIASNDASSDNEKRLSFEQAFKQLEGVIAVPEIAVDAFRIKIGLAEIEA